jgi:hypothetical protein
VLLIDEAFFIKFFMKKAFCFVHQQQYFMAAAVATLGSTLVFHGSVT